MDQSEHELNPFSQSIPQGVDLLLIWIALPGKNAPTF